MTELQKIIDGLAIYSFTQDMHPFDNINTDDPIAVWQALERLKAELVPSIPEMRIVDHYIQTLYVLIASDVVDVDNDTRTWVRQHMIHDVLKNVRDCITDMDAWNGFDKLITCDKFKELDKLSYTDLLHDIIEGYPCKANDAKLYVAAHIIDSRYEYQPCFDDALLDLVSYVLGKKNIDLPF